jgi:hypothetical protein
MDDDLNRELLLTEAVGRAVKALYVEQVGRKPFTPDEWDLRELGVRAGGNAMLDIFSERG